MLHLRSRCAAHLSHSLDEVIKPVNVRFGQAAACGVYRQSAVRPLNRPTVDERTALSALAEPEVFERHDSLAAERLEDLSYVDISRPHAGSAIKCATDLLEAGGVEARLMAHLVVQLIRRATTL